MKPAMMMVLGVLLLFCAHSTDSRKLQQGPSSTVPQQSFLTLSQAFGNMSRPALLDLVEALLDPTDLADRQAFYQHLMANTTVDHGHLVYNSAHQHPLSSHNTNSSTTHSANATAPEATPANATTTNNTTATKTEPAAPSVPVCKAAGEVCYDPMGAFPAGPSPCCDPESACIVGGGGMHVCSSVAK